ncbi:MAG: hypothetical protein M3R67_07560, partial [Acidobacteriota bacterium]|nr:hypothetical protein [Acidobacteriota bacterium]
GRVRMCRRSGERSFIHYPLCIIHYPQITQIAQIKFFQSYDTKATVLCGASLCALFLREPHVAY